MRVDPENSKYQEDPVARESFDDDELLKCRVILRRLRFLETKINQSGGLAADSGSGGALHAEAEKSALAWVLTEVGFLLEPEGAAA